MGRPIIKQKLHNNTLVYRFNSEGGIPLKLKVEVNCREHYTIYGVQNIKYAMDSEWYSGEVLISTYDLTELLGTKMRALYQRRKGRDLFDIWFAISQTNTDTNKIINAWRFYMENEHHTVSQQEFLDNMEKKISDQDFLSDIQGLLKPKLSYDIAVAYNFVKTELLEKI